MSRLKLFSLALAALFAAAPAVAALGVGAEAPDFHAWTAMNGMRSEFPFSLAAALKKGPVVLYFYPKAFTKGCTKEAHDFAAAMGRYRALGATVIGVSHDDYATVARFSAAECGKDFAVLPDPDQKIIKAYDVVWADKPQLSSRTSFVIAPSRRIIYAYTELNPDLHVANTLKALEDWKAGGSK